jgi:hypothetical protein
VECDGTNPMQHSMRSVGIALFDQRTGLVDRFYQNVEPQKDSRGQAYPPDPKTMRDFWQTLPQQWQAVQQNAVDPRTAMLRLSQWLSHHESHYNLKWVAKPSNCDWMWLKCYYEFYGPRDKPDLGYYCHDLSALIRAYKLCCSVSDNKSFLQTLSSGAPYTHHALDDAICQGHMYMKLRQLMEQKNQQKYGAPSRHWHSS